MEARFADIEPTNLENFVKWSKAQEHNFTEVHQLWKATSKPEDQATSENDPQLISLMQDLALDETSRAILTNHTWSPEQKMTLLNQLKVVYDKRDKTGDTFTNSNLFLAFTDLLESTSFQEFPGTDEQKYNLVLAWTQEHPDFDWQFSEIFAALPDALAAMKTLAWEDSQYYEFLSNMALAGGGEFHGLLEIMPEIVAVLKAPSWQPDQPLGQLLFKLFREREDIERIEYLDSSNIKLFFLDHRIF